MYLHYIFKQEDPKHKQKLIRIIKIEGILRSMQQRGQMLPSIKIIIVQEIHVDRVK